MIHCCYLFCCSDSPLLTAESSLKSAPVTFGHASLIFQALLFFLAPSAGPALFCIFPFSVLKSQLSFPRSCVYLENPLQRARRPDLKGEGLGTILLTLCSAQERGETGDFSHQKSLRWQNGGVKCRWGSSCNGGGHMPTLTSSCICGFCGSRQHLQTALCMEVCPRFSNVTLSLGCPLHPGLPSHCPPTASHGQSL